MSPRSSRPTVVRAYSPFRDGHTGRFGKLRKSTRQTVVVLLQSLVRTFFTFVHSHAREAFSEFASRYLVDPSSCSQAFELSRDLLRI